MACNPSGIDFREVKYTRYKDTTIVVKNAGKNPLSVTGIELSGPNASEFSLPGSTSLFDLQPDSTRIIKVRFTPANMLGSKTAYINFTNNSAENPKVVYLAGNCNSQPTPIITVSSELMDFGDVKVTNYNEQELNVKNSGDYDLTINSANLSGVNAKDFSFASQTNFLLKPDSSTKILVRFNPLSTGNKAAQFNFSSTSKNDPIIYLIGKALPGPKPMIQFSVNPLVFGKTAVGTQSDKPVTIKNAGEIPLEVTGMKIMGPNATEFSFVSGGGGFSLDANEQRSINIRFTPIVEGTDKSAYIEFTSNDDSKPQLQISAEAYSIPKPKIQADVAEIDFGQINNTFTKDTTFMLYNKGTADLRVELPYMSGMDSLEFSILTQAFPRNIIPDDALSIRIRFQPKTAGGKSTYLMIPSSDTQLKIPLGGVSKPYTGIEDVQAENFSVQIIPNPSTNKIRFVAKDNDCRQLLIYDNTGNLLIEFQQNEGINFEWDMKDNMNKIVPNGIYHAVFSSGTKNRSVSFVISK